MTRPTYIRVDPPWSWENGSPQERADVVRDHASGSRPLTNEALKSLFLLTDEGLSRILHGDIWRPEYQQTPGV